MRRIAEGTGLAPSTLVANFTHRRRLTAWFCSRTSRRRVQYWQRRDDRHCLTGMLPHDEEGLELESIWLGVLEMARWRDDVAEIVHEVEEDEARWVGNLLARRAAEQGEDVSRHSGWQPDPDEVTLLAALLTGLRVAMVRRRQPVTFADAVRVLERHLGLRE